MRVLGPLRLLRVKPISVDIILALVFVEKHGSHSFHNILREVERKARERVLKRGDLGEQEEDRNSRDWS